jgi:Ala-tRNA(Pro) deacylase
MNIMPVQKLKRFLDENKVAYITIFHSQAYSSDRTAASAHIPGQEFAKTVMIKIDGIMAMAILPAKYHIDFDLFRKIIPGKTVELAGESEFKNYFPNCDVGAMPPFGNLYNMETLVDRTLTEDKEIAFNAGTHRELIKLDYSDFERLVKPKIMDFAADLVQ